MIILILLLTSSKTGHYVKEKFSANLQKFPRQYNFTLAVLVFLWYLCDLMAHQILRLLRLC